MNLILSITSVIGGFAPSLLRNPANALGSSPVRYFIEGR